jgi:hypothetical protein
LTPPPWFDGLPQDPRGFYVLAEAGWIAGEPVFSKFDVDRTVALAIHRACALCGYPMPKGRDRHRVHWCLPSSATLFDQPRASGKFAVPYSFGAIPSGVGR